MVLEILTGKAYIRVEKFMADWWLAMVSDGNFAINKPTSEKMMTSAKQFHRLEAQGAKLLSSLYNHKVAASTIGKVLP